MHQWMTDGGQTPHVIVDVDRMPVDVPRAFVKDGKIVLNISYDATERLNIGNDWLELDTRFAGTCIMCARRLLRYSASTRARPGKAWCFQKRTSDRTAASPPKPPAAEEGRPRPQLKVVK